MYLEVVGFWGILCIIGFFLAEWKAGNVTVGIVSSVALILLGAWLMAEQIQIKTGETITTNQSSATLLNGTTIYPPTLQTTTNTYTYATAGFFNLNQTLGIIFMLVGGWAGLKYAFEFKSRG
jgi:hypothetical protein